MTSNITKNFKAKSALRKEHGGDVKGPGGPTDDKVGPVALSDGEYVLPADTVAAIGVDNLDALRDATHDFKSTKNRPKPPGGLRGMADGDVFYVKPDGRTARGPALPQPSRALVPTAPRTPTGTGTVPTQPPAASAVRPELMGEAGRASARASAYSAAGNPAGARLAGGTPTPPASTPAASSAPGAASRAGNALRGLGRVAGGAALVAAPVVTRNSDTKAQQELAGGGRTGNSNLDAAGNAAGQFGAYLGSAVTAAGLSPQDIGGITSSLRQTFSGNMSGPENMAAWDAVPRDQRGWARRGVEALQRGLGLAPELPDASDVRSGVQTPAGRPSATPVADALRGTGAAMTNEKPPTGPRYYADLERLHQQELAARAGGNREAQARMQAADGPGAYYQGALENRSGLANSDPRINGSTSAAYNALSDDAVIGSYNGRSVTKKEADARAAGLQTASFVPQKPAEDPLMGEIRSALRGSGGSRGGGSSFSGRDSGTDDINNRYDAMLRNGAGQNRVHGLDWSQRHGLDVERARANELGEFARNQSALRGQDITASIAADQNRTQLANTLINMQTQRERALAEDQSANARAQQDALKTAEQRQKDMTASAATVAASFAAGDKDVEANLNEVLRTLPPEMRVQIEGMTPDEREATYSNIAREHIGRTDGLVMGRDPGATVQNTVLGGLLGTMLRSNGGSSIGKGVDAVLGRIPRVGPLLSALHPAENLARLGPLLGAGAGAYVTPEAEGLDRWDPVARDPETGAAIPAKKDLLEAARYGAFDVYANPFDDAVQTRSGRRTDRPTPTEEEAARRRRSSLRE